MGGVPSYADNAWGVLTWGLRAYAGFRKGT